MAKKQSIKLNFIMNAILTMSSFIFPFISFPYISRVLGPAGNGKVSFANSLIAYFSIVAHLGIPTYGIRACAKVRDDRLALTRTAHELLIINLAMNVVMYIAFFLSLAFIPRLQGDKPLYVIVSSSILLGTIGMEWLYKAIEQYTYITVRSIIFKFIALFAMFLMVRSETDYVQYGFITIFAASASSVLNLINAHRYIDFKPVGNYNLRQHLRPILVFFAMACATTIYTNLDVLMLGFMKTDVDVGYYHAAVRIKTILVSIVTSLGAVILPRASYYVEQNLMDEFREICKKALNFVLLFATPLTVYFIIYAKYGIFLLSGESYAGSIVPMQVIMPTLLFIGVSNIMGIQILVPTGREKVVLHSEIAGAVVDVIINALLIPKLASTGAAIGTLVAEFVVVGVQYYVLRTELCSMLVGIHYLKIAVATLLGSIASAWVIMLNLGNFNTLAISGVLFFGVYGLIMLLTKEELIVEIIDQGLRRIRKR